MKHYHGGDVFSTRLCGRNSWLSVTFDVIYDKAKWHLKHKFDDDEGTKLETSLGGGWEKAGEYVLLDI